jgi:hypothetical protein
MYYKVINKYGKAISKSKELNNNSLKLRILLV